MIKSSSLFLILAVLLLFSPCSTARPLAGEQAATREDGCRGIGEEECLMRKTLAAHLDYIYTQANPKPYP
ncbi:hypothetical protein M569_07323 [Genlisea aurea]|uniref:Phytosulfokine n=1 Tax=Genlisea aurea TaxID=192259 RepID=S8CL47_9LAMI|nr:hypothetical protein M569_07323 [Genlisea aurea]